MANVVAERVPISLTPRNKVGWLAYLRSQYQPGLLPPPGMVPDDVGIHLVLDKKLDPDRAWKLMAAVHWWPKPNHRCIYHFRVFDEGECDKRNVHVMNYLDLDRHPDLILYQGVCDRRFHTLFFKES